MIGGIQRAIKYNNKNKIQIDVKYIFISFSSYLNSANSRLTIDQLKMYVSVSI